MRLISLISIGLVLLQAFVVCSECTAHRLVQDEPGHAACCDHDHGSPDDSSKDSPSHCPDCQLHHSSPSFVPVAKLLFQPSLVASMTPVCLKTADLQPLQQATREGRFDCREELAPTCAVIWSNRSS